MSGKLTVLLVEDNEIVLDDTATTLRDDGCDVLEARSYSDALAVLSQLPEGSVLITDIRLSGEHTGIDLVRTVGAQRPDMKIIIVSGVVRPDTERLPDHSLFCTKPFASGLLPELVKQSQSW